MKNIEIAVKIEVIKKDGCLDTNTVFTTEKSSGGEMSYKDIRVSGIKQVRDALSDFKERIEDLEAQELAKSEMEDI